MHDAIDDFTLPDDDDVERVVDTLRILSDPTRLRILWAMLQGESSVACLAEVATVSPTVVSQHLAKLRLAGVVRARQEGTYRYYTVVSEEVADLLRTLLSPAGERPDRVARLASRR